VTTRIVVPGATERGLTAYRQALASCMPDIEVVELLPGALEAEIAAAMASASGVMLTGGADIHPQEYHEEPDGTEMDHVQPERDSLERRVLELSDDRQLPVFAICRGMQMLNVYRSGSLRQHIEGHRDGRAQEDKWMSWHGLDVLADSRLADLFPDGNVFANSRHHQAVDEERVGYGLQVTGWCAADDVVEAIEGEREDRFVLGVQWHPENMALAPEGTIEREQARMLFGAFAEAVREFDAGR
jgi:putative glutamine amidotransferase